MGKKKGKKGKGAEKTALKTEKNAEKRAKKMLEEHGEEDIENIISRFQEEERRKNEVIEEKCDAPSPRCNMTLISHPDKDELVMFGGEYFNGSKTFLYNDLFFCNLKNNEWRRVTSPNAPPPRCAHQAVALKQGGGQMWIFGGEFASPSQSQFYHYKDLWVFHFKDKLWEKINAPGGPCSRSGHRMVASKKQLLVFGGFHDNIRDYKYYNDVYAFNLESYNWTKLITSGNGPSPRSGCVMAASQEHNRVMVYGGYSKERAKKEVDLGHTHTDMFLLSPEGKVKTEATPDKWKWSSVKQSGVRPSPRCGCSLVVTPGNRALVFGGVFDQDEDEEDVTGVFYNDIYSLELDKGKWHDVILRGKRDLKEKKKRRRMKEKEDAEDRDSGEGTDLDSDMEDDVKKLKVSDESKDVIPMEETGASSGDVTDLPGASAIETAKDTSAFEESVRQQSVSDSIFTVTMGPQSGHCTDRQTDEADGMEEDIFIPSARMNALLAVHRGVLYMYGGLYEDGDKQITLSDFYSLDLHKLDEWKVIIAQDMTHLEWEESESSGSDEEDENDMAELEDTEGGEMEGAVGGEEDMETDEEDSDGDNDDDQTADSAPGVATGEGFDQYLDRTGDYWLRRAEQMANNEGLEGFAKQLKKAASKMAKEQFQSTTS